VALPLPRVKRRSGDSLDALESQTRVCRAAIINPNSDKSPRYYSRASIAAGAKQHESLLNLHHDGRIQPRVIAPRGHAFQRRFYVRQATTVISAMVY